MIEDFLLPYLRLLQLAYPNGLPDSDYAPLLVVLAEEFAEENLARLVAHFSNRDPIVVDNDAAAFRGPFPPPVGEVRRVRVHLESRGWQFDDAE